MADEAARCTRHSSAVKSKKPLPPIRKLADILIGPCIAEAFYKRSEQFIWHIPPTCMAPTTED
ncbi:hypothetical protein ACJ72_06711 [Emergomyces africanus]|uniref:Uncharacterized protein n=1 Tax=Emergomyces africanus TaxID=1955775 RepID=A0A1B7NQS3_9EURO|nr:hypothetical protein ACJ72_06711 [Emergomyces africanus]